MSEQFNPYREWLDLSGVESAPDHYTLLGLDRFESNSPAIAQAADRMMSRVRGFRPGEHARVWAKILDDLLEAKQCLTSPQRKAAYDTELRRGDSGGRTPSNESAPASIPSASPDAAAFYPPGMGPAPADDRMPSQPVQQPQQPVQQPSQPVQQPQQPIQQPQQPSPVQQPSPMQQPSPAPFDPNMQQPYPQGPQPPMSPGQQPYDPNTQQPYPQSPQQPMQPGMQQPMQPADPQGYVPNYNYPQQQYPPQGQQPYQPVPGQPYGAGMTQPYPQPTPAPVPVGVSMPTGGTSTADRAEAPKPPPAVSAYRSMAPPARQRSSMAMMYVGLIAGVLILVWLALRMTDNNSSPAGPGGGANVAQNGGNSQGGSGGTLGTSGLAPTRPSVPATSGNGGSARPAIGNPRTGESGPTTNSAGPQLNDHRRPFDVTGPIAVEPANPSADDPPATDTGGDDTGGPHRLPQTGPLPGSPPDPEDAGVPRQSREELAELGRMLTTARRALAERNLVVAENELARAENLAKLPEHREKLDRLKTLHQYVQEFWKAVSESVDGLRANEELRIGETIALVVETRPNLLIIRVAGTNRRYTPRDIPAGLAKSLAERWLDEKAISSKVILGAFLVVDPKSTPARARRAWQEAQAAGFELGDMMKVIDDTYGFATESVEQQAAALVPERGPVPTPEAIKPVEEQFDVQYGEQLVQATRSSKRFRLAGRLFTAARNSTDPIERYVLLTHTRDLAMQAGQTPLMLRAIDEIGAWYDVDTLAEKATALTTAGKSATHLLTAKALTRGALEVLEQAVAANRPDLAVRCAAVAVSTARHTRDADLAKKARERQAEVEEMAAAKPK